MMEKMTRAPKIIGDTWFNSRPLSLDDFKGKVVLYDFWTYSCVNCRRTLPYLRQWWERYKDKDFILLGIHTPEFEFEKDPQNVEQAIKDLRVTWPVVMDNDYVNWNNFTNHFWPAKYLADKDGKIVYSHFGEGGYKKTESKIREVLKLEDVNDVSEMVKKEHEHLSAEALAKAGGSVCFPATPETYCGYERGSLANKEGYQRDTETDYVKPDNINDGEIGLFGKFVAHKEYIESVNVGAEISLRFHATEVNLVLHAADKEAVAEVNFEGESPTGDVFGHDVSKAREVNILKPTMYNLLRSHGLMDGTLTIKAKEGAFRAYAFTFSGCEHS